MISLFDFKRELHKHTKTLAMFFLVFAVLLIYLAPFVAFEQSSRQASLVRVSLLISSVLFVTVSFEGLKSFCLVRFSYLYFFVLLLFSYLFLNSLFLSDDFKSIRRLLLLLVLFIPFLYVDINERKVRFILIFIVAVISFFAAFSLLNHYINGTLPQGYRRDGLIDSGIPQIASFGNTIISGMHYAIAFSIVTYLYFTERNYFLLLLWGALKLIVIVYIALTFARTAWVAAFVSFIVLFLMTFDKKKIRFYILIMLAVPVVVFFLLNYIGYEIGERGLTHRDKIWKASILKIEENWIFGHGLLNSIGWVCIDDGKRCFNNSHSLYLEIIYQVGLVGLLLYLCCIFSAAYVLFKSFTLKVFGSLSVLFIAVLSSISVVMTVDIIGWINSPGLVWMWLWLPLAVSIVFERKLNTVNIINNI